MKNGSLVLHQVLPNTLYYDEVFTPTLDMLHWMSPPKLRTRLTINNSGLNTMTTIVIPKGKVSTLTPDKLMDFSKLANKINEEIGLPTSNDLIIRSASHDLKIENGKVVPKVSEPSLLVMGASNKSPSYKPLTSGSSFSNFSEFIHEVRNNYDLIIHDDNDTLQKNSVHGKVTQHSGNFELLIGTDTLHSRDLGENGAPYPYVKFSTNHLDNIETIDPRRLSDTLMELQVIDTPRIQIQARNSNTQSLNFMLSKIKKEIPLIEEILWRSQKQFGKDCVVEFRSYNIPILGIGRNLQVLDINRKF